MTAELRNLPHIASMAFNEPLMLEPAYARAEKYLGEIIASIKYSLKYRNLC